MKESPSASPNLLPPTTAHPDHADQRAAIQLRILRLERRSSNGLYVLALFIIVSIGAAQNFSLLPSLPPAITRIMGKPPSAQMISAALILYLFSAIILTFGRMMEGTGKSGSFAHLGYLAAFYFFYHFSGDMDVHFWAVFAAGITVLGLESYHQWQFCREEIHKERALLTELDNRTRLDALTDNH